MLNDWIMVVCMDGLMVTLDRIGTLDTVGALNGNFSLASTLIWAIAVLDGIPPIHITICK